MSSLLSRLEDRATHMSGRCWPRPLTVDVATAPTGNIGHHIDRSHEHELCLRLRVTYWANKAQEFDARQEATKALLHLLYADALGELAMLRRAISSGDQNEAYERALRIESILTEGEV